MSAWSVPVKSDTGGGTYEKPPAGNHPARLVALIDMGTQRNDYQGDVKEQHRIFFVWELVNAPKADGTNHVVGFDLTFSMHEKSTMRKWIESRRGAKIADAGPFDISQELNQACLLNVVDKPSGDRVYVKVMGMSAVPAGFNVPAAKNQPFAWNLAEYVPGQPINLPVWVPYLYGKSIVDHIRASKELLAIGGGVPASRTPQQSSPAAPPPPSRPTPPPRQAGVGVDENEQFWIDHPDLEATKTYARKEIERFMSDKALPAKDVMLCKMGDNAWKTAVEFNFMGGPF